MDFPLLMTRIEGEYCKYFGALINADGLDTFTISGKGTIDGNGTPLLESFPPTSRMESSMYKQGRNATTPTLHSSLP